MFKRKARANKLKARQHRRRRRTLAAGSSHQHRGLEVLEPRILLTTLTADEVFEYRAPDPTNPEDDGTVIRVALTGDAIIELIGADVDDENQLVLGDIPGVIRKSSIGRENARILGGLGGADGVVVIGDTPIEDSEFFFGSIPVDTEDTSLNNILAIASHDALGNGDTYGMHLATVTIDEETEQTIVQLLQHDNRNGDATVQAMFHQATLREDVMARLSTGAAARGSITFIGGVNPIDQMQIDISDGTTTITFEFDDGGGAPPETTAVPIGATAADTLTNLIDSINASALNNFNVVDATVGDPQADLIGHNGAAGNVAITTNFSLTIGVTGMEGGTNFLGLVGGFAVDPTTGLGYAVAELNGLSRLYRINRISGGVTDLGLLTNTDTGNALATVNALAINSTGQIFILTQDYDGNPALDTSGLPSDEEGNTSLLDTALVTIDKTDATFDNGDIQSVLAEGFEVVAPYTGMAFDSGDLLYAALREVNEFDDAASTLHRLPVGEGGAPLAAVVGGPIQFPDETDTDIQALTFAKTAGNVEILVGMELSEFSEETGILARLVSIAGSGGANLLGEKGTVAAFRGLGSFTEAGSDRPLLFAMTGTRLVRGSSVILPVDEETGVTVVTSILGADFQPRIGTDTDGRLFFVFSAGNDELDLLYHIDVTAPNRSAIQNSLGLIGGGMTENDENDVQITTIAWDQTSPTTADLIGFDSVTMSLVRIDTGNTNDSIFGPAVTLFDEEVESITGLAFEDDPEVPEQFVLGVRNEGSDSNLLRIRMDAGTCFILGPLSDVDDPDNPESPLYAEGNDGPVSGENIGSLTFNPIAPNPFVGGQGVLLGVDSTTDELLAIDSRARFPTAEVFAIYVSQASIGSSIAIAAVPDPEDDDEEENNVMQPFEGNAGEIRVFDAQGGELILVSANDGTGQFYLGARTEDIDNDNDDEDLLPIIAATLAKQIGVRAAGVNDLPDIAGNLSAGIIVDDNLLEYFSFESDLADRLLGLNVDIVDELAVSRDGSEIFAVDTDQSSELVPVGSVTNETTGSGTVAIDQSLLNPNDFTFLGEKWPQPEPGEQVTVTYSYSNLLDTEEPPFPDLANEVIRATVEEGFALWASFAPLNFVEVVDEGPLPDSDAGYDGTNLPQIRIGAHTFDGPMGVLGHAVSPDPNKPTTSGVAGDIHFDIEDAAFFTNVGYFLEVFVHEAGHALGIGHETAVTPRVDDPGPSGSPIMNPLVLGVYPGLGTSFLFQDDVDAIQALYGLGSGTVSPLGVGDELVRIDPATGLAENTAPIFDAVTGVRLKGVQGLDFGDVNFDGEEELHAIMDVVNFLPQIDIGGDLGTIIDVDGNPAGGGDLNIQGLAVTLGNIMYAVDDDADMLRLLRIDRDANGAITGIVDLGDITDDQGNPITDIRALTADPFTGALFAVGVRADVGNPTTRELFIISLFTVDTDLDLTADEVVATPMGTLNDGAPVNNPIEALAARPDPGADTFTLYAVRDLVGQDALITIDLDGTVTNVGDINVGGLSTDIIAMAYAPDSRLMIAIDTKGGTGNRRLVVLNLANPSTGSLILTVAGSVADQLMALASGNNDLFYSVNDGGVDPNTIHVSPGPTPTLGKIDTSDTGLGTFTTIGAVGEGMITTVNGMTFALGEGSIQAQQGLFIVDDWSNLFELDPTNGSIVDRNGDLVGDLADAIGVVTDPDGNVVTVGSFDIDRNGIAFAHDTFNGRLVDVDLGTAEAGANTVTSDGSLRPTVGAISFDFENNEFLAVDNVTGLLPLGSAEGGSVESAVLMRLVDTETESPKLQSMSDFLLGGTVTGKVNLSGSVDTFYAGWLVTGATGGQTPLGPDVPDNFLIGGDLRDLIVRDSIGTNDGSSLQNPEYLSGFDLEVAGKVGQIWSAEDFIGSVNIQNRDDIPKLDALTLFQNEIESRSGGGDEDGVEGILFEQFELFDSGGLFNNDTLETAQIVGSVRSGLLGSEDIVRILGGLASFTDDQDEITITEITNDEVDYFAVPLMAGKTFKIELISLFDSANTLAVYDPDGRLIATDRHTPEADGNHIGVLNQPFLLTTDRPGLYRFGVGFNLEGITGSISEFREPAPYLIQIEGVGDIGLGALKASNNIFAADPFDPTLSVEAGDLGALTAGGVFWANAVDVVTDADENVLSASVTNVSVPHGNLRVLEADQVGRGDIETFEGSAVPTLGVPNGDIGMLRSQSGVLRFNFVELGGNLQLVDAATDFYMVLEADGGMGVVRAGQMSTPGVNSAFRLNLDGTGRDGIIDLIDIVGDFASPVIETGPGGNVRYIRVGGTVTQDPFFAGPATVELSPGASFTLEDDSGGQITLTPAGQVPNPNFVEGGNEPGIATSALTLTTYGIRGSGGSVLVRAEVNGSLEVASNSFGNDSPVEISEIVISADGVGVAETLNGDLDFELVTDGATGLQNLHLNITGSAAVDVFSIVAGTTVTTADGGAPTVDRTGTGGGGFRYIRNDTGGELVSADIGGVGTLFNTGPIGLPKNHTGALVNPQLYAPMANLGFPFNQQGFGIVTQGNVIKIRSNMGIGNLAIGGSGSGGVGSLGRLLPNDDRVDVVDAFEGLDGPVLVAGSLDRVNIGEGLGPSGTGDLAKAGLFVGVITDPGGSIIGEAGTGVIGSIVNQGLGSDIHGNITASGRIDRIELIDGAIIDAKIFQTIDPSGTRVFSDAVIAEEIADTIDEPQFEIGQVILRGAGGIIGGSFAASDIGDVTVKDGFGLLSSTFRTTGGVMGDFTVDGYGIRNTSFSDVARIGDIDATGQGTVISTLSFTPTVRRSESFAFNPIYDTNINIFTDLHYVLDTSLANPLETEGLIEDVDASGTLDLGMVSAYQIVATNPDLNPTNFNFANSIGGFHTDNIIDGLEVTTGSLGTFKPGSDVSALAMKIAGPIQNMLFKGDLLNSSSIRVSGPNANVRKFRVDGDMDGSIDIDGRAGTFDIRGDLSGNITIRATNEDKVALKTFKLRGALTNGSLDVRNDVGTIDVAGSVGIAGDTLTINGNLKTLKVGTSKAVANDGSSLALDLMVLGDLKTFDVTGKVDGQVTVTGNVTKFNIWADTVTAGSSVLNNDVQIFGEAKNVSITGGDVAADFAVGTDIGKFNLTGGDLLAAATISSSLGDIDQVAMRNGDLFGSILANNGTINLISVLGSDMGGAIGTAMIGDANAEDEDTITIGDGVTTAMFEFDDGGGVAPENTAVLIGSDAANSAANLAAAINGSALTINAVQNSANPQQVDLTNTVPQLGATVPLTTTGANLNATSASPASISAQSIGSIKFDGSMKAGSSITVQEDVSQLIFGLDIETGATVTVDQLHRVDVGRDMNGTLALGRTDKATQLNVGRDLGGNTNINGNAKIDVGRDVTNSAVVSIGNDLELFNADGTVFGNTHVEGHGGRFTFGAMTGAVLTTGFDLKGLLVDQAINNTLVQAGVRRGDNGIFAAVESDKDADEDTRMGRIGTAAAESITESILASGGGWQRLDIDTDMTDSTAASGLVIGSTAIAAVLVDPTPLADAAERSAALSAADRVLYRGDFEYVNIAGSTITRSSLSAGVDPVDGVFGNADDAVLFQHADRALPDGGGNSRFGTLNANLDATSFVVADNGIARNNTTGSGTIIPNVSYTIGDITANNPLTTLIGIATDGAPVTFFSANGETVTIVVRGAGEVAVHDDAGLATDSNNVIDTLVITGTDANTQIDATTSLPGSVNVGRIITGDDVLVRDMAFDGTIVGDGSDDLDLLFDTTGNRYRFGGFGDNFTGIIGGDIQILDVEAFGAGRFRVLGSVGAVNVVEATGDSSLLTDLASTPTDDIVAMATDSVGNTWVFDATTGQLSQVDPITGTVLSGPLPVTNAFGGAAISLKAIDFDGSDTLFGVAELNNPTPSQFLGGIVEPGTPLALRGLTELADGRIVAVDTAGGTDMLVGLNPASGGVDPLASLIDFFGNKFVDNTFSLASDDDGNTFALVNDRDGDGGAFGIDAADPDNILGFGSAIAMVNLNNIVDGNTLLTNPNDTNRPPVLLDGGGFVVDGVAASFTAMAVDNSGKIFAIVRDLLAGQDQLVVIGLDGTVDNRGVVQVDGTDTNIIGMGFDNGNLIAATNSGTSAELIAMDRTAPGASVPVTQPGVVDTTLDAFALGRMPNFNTFAYDTNDVAGGQFFTSPGVAPVLVTVDTTTGQATAIQPLAKDGNGSPLVESSAMASSDVPKSIVDVSTLTSQLDMAGTDGIITDVNASLNITHPFDSDLTATLISPTGTRVVLFSGAGADGHSFINTTLDDDTENPISFGDAPFTGTFQPQELLAAFNGEDANGQWTLEIIDSTFENAGTLDNWTLNVTSTAGIADIAVDNAGTGDLFVTTTSDQLFQYDPAAGSFVADHGTLIDTNTGFPVEVSTNDFDDLTGKFVGVDPQRRRLIEIDPMTGGTVVLSQPGSIPADLTTFSFTTTGAGTFLAVDRKSDTFVQFNGTTNAALVGMEAHSIERLNITGQGESSGRFVTLDGFGLINITGPFSGTIDTSGDIQRLTQSGGNFSGTVIADQEVAIATFSGGDFVKDGVLRANVLGSVVVRDGDLAGTIDTVEADGLRIKGSGLSTAAVTVTSTIDTVRFGGDFDGQLDLGGVTKGLKIDGTVGADGDIQIRGDSPSISLGGTEAGSVVTSDGYINTLTIASTHAGIAASKFGVGRARLDQVNGGVLAAGLNTGSLAVRGRSNDGMFLFGIWIGSDRTPNTNDDLITGGSIGSAVFSDDYVDTVLATGVLPNVSAVTSNVQGRPNDNFAFVGDSTAATIGQTDSSEAGGILASTIGRMSIGGFVTNTSVASGRVSVATAADGIGRVSAGPSAPSLLQRVYGDPVGPPTTVDTTVVTQSELQVVFSEPINSGSLILARDVDDNGMLGDPADVPGSVIVTDTDGNILDDVILQYTTQTNAENQTEGVLRVLRDDGFEGIVTVTLRGPIVDQNGFADNPAVIDRSGLRSALRDFDQDGIQAIDEDRLGTIFDGDKDGNEGGNEDLIFILDDVADSFIESLSDPKVPLILNGPGVVVNQKFDDFFDIDVYRFTADTYQFFTVAYEGDAAVQMGVFIRDDQGTLETLPEGLSPQTDDTFEILTRWELQDDAAFASIYGSNFDEDLFMAFELPPMEEVITISEGPVPQTLGFRTTDIEYFVAIFPTDTAASNENYRLTLSLASTDTLLGTLPADESIAYISNELNENYNEQGFQSPKQLVYLNFDGGVSSQVRPGETVQAFSAATINPTFVGMEDQMINGTSNLVGIVDRVVEIFANTSASHPAGTLNVQELGSDLSAFLDPSAEGIFVTTVDPALSGLDPDTDFTTALVGQLQTPMPGQLGTASTIDFANMSKADEAIVFAQNFAFLFPGGNDVNALLQQFADGLAGTISHELGHVFGLTHTVRNTVQDDPNNDGDPFDAVPADELNLIVAGPGREQEDFLAIPVIGTSAIFPDEFRSIGNAGPSPDSEAFIDSATNLLFWLS